MVCAPNHRIVGVTASIVAVNENLGVDDFHSTGSVISTGDTTAAQSVIVDRGNGSCHVSAMFGRCDGVVVVVEVSTSVSPGRNNHSIEIFVGHVDTPINNRNYDIFGAGRVVFPNRNNIDVGAGFPISLGAVIVVVPLLRETGVVEEICGSALDSSNRFLINYAGNCVKRADSSLGLYVLFFIVGDDIPLMQSCLAVPFLPLSSVFIQTPNACRVHCGKSIVKNLHSSAADTAFHQLSFDSLDGSAVKLDNQFPGNKAGKSFLFLTLLKCSVSMHGFLNTGSRANERAKRQ